MALPHITNITAGVNQYDPMFGNIFVVSFSLPDGIQNEFNKDVEILSEHVTKISGIDALDKGAAVSTQKFLGVDVSYHQPRLESTYADLSITLNLNLRDGTDAYIYKLFRAWQRLAYNVSTGERHLKKDCCASWMRVTIANQAGDIYRDIVFKDVMLYDTISGLGDLDYSNGEAKTLDVKFRSDWWTEDIA